MTIRPRSFLSICAITLLITACTPTTGPTTGESSSSSVTIMEPGADGVEDSEMEPGADGEENEEEEHASSSPASGVQVSVHVEASAEVKASRIIDVSVQNFTFSPSTITVKKGEKVTIRLKGTEGNHGFAIAELGVNTTIMAGKTVSIELPTDTAGTFTYFCSVPCGSGHSTMKGTLRITE